MGDLNSLQQNVEAGEGWSEAGPKQVLGQGMLPELDKGSCQPCLLHGQLSGPHPGFSTLHQQVGKEGVWKGKPLCTNQMG